MQKFCANCGAPLQENTFICPNCGALPSSDTASWQPQQATDTTGSVTIAAPKTARAFKWWFAAIPAVLVVAITLALCWQALLMAVAPKAALANAMGRTGELLLERYQSSPSAVFDRGIGFAENGEMVIDFDAEYQEQNYSGQLSAAFNREAYQSALRASINMMDKSLTASLYLDDKFAAVNADFFNDGTYYGVTFDTFCQDAMDSILGEYLTEEQIQEADELIQSFLEVYTDQTDTEALVAPYCQIIEAFILSLEPKKTDAQVTLDGKTYDCTALSFLLTKEDMLDLYEQLLDTLKDDDAMKAMICQDLYSAIDGEDMDSVWNELIDSLEEAQDFIRGEAEISADVTFFVRSGRLVSVGIDAQVEAEGEAVDVDFDMAYGLQYDSDLTYKLVMECDGEQASVELISHVSEENGMFKETLSLIVEAPDESPIECKFTTKWNKASEKLRLNLECKYDGETELDFDFHCELKELENGFCLRINEDSIASIVDAMDGAMPEGMEFTLSIACTEGTQIEVPEYVNLDRFDETLIQQFQQALYDNFYNDLP